MKKKEKIKRKGKHFIVLGIIILFITLMVIGIIVYINYCKTNEINIIFQKYSLEQNEPEKASEHLLKDKEFEGIQIKEISIKKEDGIVYFSAKIENKTDKCYEGKDIKIKFVDENNKPIANLKTKIETINPNEVANIQLSTSIDLTKAYDFVIE